jgi:queuine/archaeosine tRNA-ribosyltransferase
LSQLQLGSSIIILKNILEEENQRKNIEWEMVVTANRMATARLADSRQTFGIKNPQ